MPGVEIVESKENQKGPRRMGVGAGPQPAAAAAVRPCCFPWSVPQGRATHRCNCTQLATSRLGRIVDFDL
jgi:hypothetical protein